MSNNKLYENWRNELLKEIRINICTPCEDTRKQQSQLNYDNPLQCGCRCERVEMILNHAREIDTYLKN